MDYIARFLAHPIARLVMLTQLSVAVCACDDEPVLPGNDKVLAKVEGQEITAYDLERALDKSLGQFAVESVERGARKEVLESLIQSRAMATLGEKKLSEQQRAVLEKEVAAYRESLLVKHYLSTESPPEAVSAQQIRKYYDDHPERFGAVSDARYELLFGKSPVQGAERVQVMKALSMASQGDDWKQYAAEPVEGVELGYSTGSVGEKALHPKLKSLLNGLEVGAASNVAFVQGRAYVGRLTAKEAIPPKPLSEVRGEIEKMLTPVKIRDAVRNVGADAAKAVKVERLPLDEPGGGQP